MKTKTVRVFGKKADVLGEDEEGVYVWFDEPHLKYGLYIGVGDLQEVTQRG